MSSAHTRVVPALGAAADRAGSCRCGGSLQGLHLGGAGGSGWLGLLMGAVCGLEATESGGPESTVGDTETALMGVEANSAASGVVGSRAYDLIGVGARKKLLIVSTDLLTPRAAVASGVLPPCASFPKSGVLDLRRGEEVDCLCGGDSSSIVCAIASNLASSPNEFSDRVVSSV